ncbi:hypothetical protein P152DRAFT_459656 [Eremomyces bilateralis CBS 781.70]|uniref:Uncharacterized protein n=1 Tax=Eremomyces bilateralis CBS 781.70 TaxID=1392243 RepID=A0A6G1FZF8_9PEZI|nr:uncharacterized protein P152DRAFT_459656 [Eremomyces bilateralis CBS 781.70]KAF1811255.1 hypothetical protein P152DRAFT_459656 [Eremomyces bilateralis CBS 781.70]
MAAMASSERLEQPAEVANKVLRRAQVSKMTRALQNRLALANVKIQHGWQNMSLDSIEPKVDLELKRKRPASSRDVMSDCSSSISDRYYPVGMLDSSPLGGPMFSDDLPRSGSTINGSNKRKKFYNPDQLRRPVSSSHTRTKVRAGHTKVSTWKSSYQLAQSSPSLPNRHSSFPTQPVRSNISFASMPRDATPTSVCSSETDDEDLPVLSFNAGSAGGPRVPKLQIRSSPPARSPRTPPPGFSRSSRLHSRPFTEPRAPQQDAADLLMYLAASPSPAQPNHSTSNIRTPRVNAPSTPPPKQTPLPSTMMSTPGGNPASFLGFGSQTPNAVNFEDFLHFTPSPAQAAWKTPSGKTPGRRRVNFDHRTMDEGKERPKGLGMELGGELPTSK